MKRLALLLFFAISLLFQPLSLSANLPPNNFLTHPRQLEYPLSLLMQYPIVRHLISQAQKQGRISLAYEPFGAHSPNAMWRGHERKIVINASKKRSSGEILRSILFEMHNALTTRNFHYYDSWARKGYLSKQQYIKQVEWQEHQNALRTLKILEQGIKEGYFPPEARWDIAPDFERHFEIQLKSGHSQLISQTFDRITQPSLS